MKQSNILSFFIVLSILFAFISGCEKRQDAPSVENETSSEPSVKTTTEPKTPTPTISPIMKQFLSETPNTVQVTKGSPIGDSFEVWEMVLRHKSMDIHFEVEAKGTVQESHEWKNKTYRQILDEYCQDNDLAWKIIDTNIIRIEKKSM